MKRSFLAIGMFLTSLMFITSVQADAPVVARDSHGNMYRAWRGSTDNNVYFNRSSDNGTTWQAQDTLLSHPDSSYYDNLRILCDENGHLYVAWIGLIDGNKFVIFFRSDDHGQTWASQQFNIGPTGWWLGRIEMDNDPAGTLCLITNGSGSFPTGIYSRCSRDYGQTWQLTDRQVHSNTPSGIQVQTEADICLDDHGHNYAAWSDGRDGGRGGWRYIYFNHSPDFGDSWQTDQRLQPPQYAINGSSPTVSCSNNGEVTVSWPQFDGQLMTNSNCSNHSADYGLTWDGVQCSPLVPGGDPGGDVDTSIYQNFELNNGSDQYGWGFNGAVVQLTQEAVHSGTSSWKMVSPGLWGGTGLQSQAQRWDMNFHPERNDRLTFWIKANPTGDPINTVGVKFFDNAAFFKDGVEVWTTRTARFQEWTELEVLFSQLPANFDLTHVNKLEFINYWPGTYYFDDIVLAARDRVYQDLERCSSAEDCGWAWDGTVSLDQDIVKEGKVSWKLVTTKNWAGTGIKSQEKKYNPLDADVQSFWHVDLDPERNTQLTFWVYALPDNGMDNNVAVQFFDHGEHFTVDKAVVVWTDRTATNGQWTKLAVKFSDLPSTLNLKDINKIQFQVYWPGTYYFDDIRATRDTPLIDPVALQQGRIEWDPLAPAQRYDLQFSLAGPQGPWQDGFSGTDTGLDVLRLSPFWLRVRWAMNASSLFPLAYESDWSSAIFYQPPILVIDKSSLSRGDIEWKAFPIPQSTSLSYQIQSALSVQGPWEDTYSGPYTTLSQQANPLVFYRVRAVRDLNGSVDASAWGPAIAYDPGQFVAAQGQLLRKNRGTGEEIILRGVNLGNWLLIEPEFVGIGGPFTPDDLLDDDDHSIRAELIRRFGDESMRNLLARFQSSYLQEHDFDRILGMGFNLVRLPIYHEALQNEEGAITEFARLDEVISFCADRGLYVLLDLHGAPGAQSKEIHSGRADFNRLFEDTSEGQQYRDQTVALWEALATRYRDNTTVVGYDLLNEPYGAADHALSYHASNGLWTFYDRLYRSIRAIDPDHLIVMEGIPSGSDWETLPDPDLYGWENVLYQLHFYGFSFDDQGKITGTLPPPEHRLYLADKIDQSRQKEYEVPVLIGEFNGFDQRVNWESYLRTFTRLHWSWALWSYKAHPSRKDWGLFVHTDYDENVVSVHEDDEPTLTKKLSKYDTVSHHTANASLQAILKGALNTPRIADQTEDAVTHDWYRVTLPVPQNLPLAVLASIASFDDGDPAGLRLRNVTSGTWEVKIEEEQSRDKEVQHSSETVGFAVLTSGSLLNAAQAPIGEVGIITAEQKNAKIWLRRNFQRAYQKPVVIMQLLTFNGAEPCHTRVRNVTSRSFEFQIEEWDYLNGSHTQEQLAYLVLEQGVHRLTDGSTVEAGVVSATNLWSDVVFQTGFLAAPVTLSHCQTYNGSQAVVTRQRDITRQGFSVKLQEEQARNKKHNPETVGYIAFE